jgi:hypothetical protein
MNIINRLPGRIALFVLITSVVVGCGRVQPVYQVQSQQISNISGSMTLDQIEKKIIHAAQTRKWILNRIKPGHLDARYSWKRHSANVSILFDSKN